MTSSTGGSRECPIVEGRVCDPDVCDRYVGASQVREIADIYNTCSRNRSKRS